MDQAIILKEMNSKSFCKTSPTVKHIKIFAQILAKNLKKLKELALSIAIKNEDDRTCTLANKIYRSEGKCSKFDDPTNQ